MNFIRSSVLMDYFLFIVCVLDVFLNLVSIFVGLKKKNVLKAFMIQHFVSLLIVEYVGIQRYSKVNNKLTTDVSLFFRTRFF